MIYTSSVQSSSTRPYSQGNQEKHFYAYASFRLSSGFMLHCTAVRGTYRGMGKQAHKFLVMPVLRYAIPCMPITVRRRCTLSPYSKSPVISPSRHLLFMLIRIRWKLIEKLIENKQNTR